MIDIKKALASGYRAERFEIVILEVAGPATAPCGPDERSARPRGFPFGLAMGINRQASLQGQR